MAETTPNTASSFPLRTRFALRFLKTLKRMKYHSSHRIKLAAYSSMARAVGNSRVWSRAMLSKLQPATTSSSSSRRRRRRRSMKVCCSSRTPIRQAKNKKPTSSSEELRRLVPGGESMDGCSLLEETAHFVQCLAMQVKVMKIIVDHYNSCSS